MPEPGKHRLRIYPAPARLEERIESEPMPRPRMSHLTLALNGLRFRRAAKLGAPEC